MDLTNALLSHMCTVIEINVYSPYLHSHSDSIINKYKFISHINKWTKIINTNKQTLQLFAGPRIPHMGAQHKLSTQQDMELV